MTHQGLTNDHKSADWADLANIEFDTLGAIHDFGETGRLVAMKAADLLNSALGDLYGALMATPALSRSPEKARRLLRPLDWTARHQLPSAQKRFSQLFPRLNQVYGEELRALRTHKGIDLTKGR